MAVMGSIAQKDRWNEKLIPGAMFAGDRVD